MGAFGVTRDGDRWNTLTFMDTQSGRRLRVPTLHPTRASKPDCTVIYRGIVAGLPCAIVTCVRDADTNTSMFLACLWGRDNGRGTASCADESPSARSARGRR